MELNDFILLFSNLCDDTEVSEITPETEFRELDDWSSLFSLSLIAQIAEETGIQFTNDKIKEAKTIKDLFELIKMK